MEARRETVFQIYAANLIKIRKGEETVRFKPVKRTNLGLVTPPQTRPSNVSEKLEAGAYDMIGERL